MSTARRLGLLASLYFAQGLPYGFFAKGLPALMRKEQISLEGIGLTGLLFLPWALKFTLGPLVDGAGRRRSWILPLQWAAAATLVALSALSLTSDLALVLALVLVVNVLSATQDVATDGLAVDLLERRERGLGNGVQVGAYRVGMIFGGGVILLLYAHLGWRGGFLVMAGLLVLATLPVLGYREPPRPRRPEGAPRVSLRAAFGGFLARPGAAAWLLVLVLYKAFDALPGPMVGPMLVEQGYDIEAIGAVLGALGSAAALLGAVVGGALVSRLPRAGVLVVFGLLQALALALYLFPAGGLGGDAMLYAAIGADSFLGTIATVALFATMMDVCRPGWSATDYTVQASLVVVATGVSGAASGFLAAELGYLGLFGTSVVLTLVGWMAVRALLRRGLLTRVTQGIS